MKVPRKIVLASSNVGKIREIQRLLQHLDVTVVPQSEFDVSDADETGVTFEENAIIKARHASIATGLPAIADDSGLLVDALGGKPGVYSARYSGRGATDDSNIDKLLIELDGKDNRRAAFHCVACYVSPDTPEPLLAGGSWEGEILEVRRGTGGFGYDPVFLDPELGKTSAELEPAEKNARSHRGKALAALADALSAHQE